MIPFPRILRPFGLATFVALWAVAGAANPVLEAVRGVERDLDARIGFYLHDLESGEVITWAAEDRFPLNSTFKLLACGALLHGVETGEVALSDAVALRDVEIVTYSPAILAWQRGGATEVTLGQACAMVLSVSDNTAANIVLAAIGGPTGLTAFLRDIGDETTRLDRWEPEMSASVPGDLRDTTSPQAIARSVQRLILGDALAPASQQVLRGWLADHEVADLLFRDALPPDWSIDDRTGAGGYGSRSIVAVLYPPGRAPIVAALFLTETRADLARRNAAIAAVGAAIVGWVEDA